MNALRRALHKQSDARQKNQNKHRSIFVPNPPPLCVCVQGGQLRSGLSEHSETAG